MKEEIEKLIVDALKETANLVLNRDVTSRIIMPIYRSIEDEDESIRYSEQELKEIFISKIEKSTSLYYSVETPSKYVYSISNSEVPEIKKLKDRDDHFESARIDVSLYDSREPKDLLSHIEFKHGNPDEKEISKDFLRLTHEFGKYNCNYFVHYIVRGSDRWKSETFPSIMKKYCKATDISCVEKYDLENTKIFLMFVKIRKDEEISILKFDLKKIKENFGEVQKYESEKFKQWMEIL